MKRDLSNRIDAFLANAYVEDAADPEYQESFAGEGSRKAQYIVDDLRLRESEGQLRPIRLAYFCVGGADGSEVEHVLSGTGIPKAVMIEISSDGVAAARERSQRLASNGKEFVVVQGDATAALDEALAVAESWCAAGSIDGLVCSAQGVLHELPTRSPGFDLPVFLGKIFRYPGWRTCAFYSREPCRPAEWPECVRVRIPGLPAADFVRMARYVRDRLRMKGNPEALASGWVDLPAQLAIETLHKLIRGGSIRRIDYELGEQLTGFDPTAVKNHLQTLVDGMHVTIDHVTTPGFRMALRDYEVEYVGHDSESLPVPKTHSEIIGFMCTAGVGYPETASFAQRADSNLAPADSTFRNPFAPDINDAEIREWLQQFEPDERPIICRLLEGFRYIRFEQIKALATALHEAVTLELDDAIDRAWFVPLGGLAKSGGLVAYVYRAQNGLPAERFLSPDQVAEVVLPRDPVVLLDDLLASGHQALYEWDRMTGLGSVPVGSRGVIATLVSFEAGREWVEDRSELRSVSALRFDRSQEPLSSDSELFPQLEDRDRLREILEKYAGALGTRTPFGYAGSGLVFAFDYAIPDNSCPIFWAAGPHWRPIITRRTPARLGYGQRDEASASERGARADA